MAGTYFNDELLTTFGGLLKNAKAIFNVFSTSSRWAKKAKAIFNVSSTSSRWAKNAKAIFNVSSPSSRWAKNAKANQKRFPPLARGEVALPKGNDGEVYLNFNYELLITNY